MGWSGSQREEFTVENWKWGIDFSRIAQKLAKKLKNCEENRSSWTSKNWWLVYASKEGSCCYESTLDSNSAITNRVNSLSDAREFLRSWNSEQLWSVPRSFVNPWLFRVPEQCLAAILTFLNDCLLEKDHPQLSSKIQRIWHHLLADLDLTLQEIRWYRKVKWDGNRRIRQCLYHAFKEEVESLIILVELILTVGRWDTRDFQSRTCIWENSQTLEFQSWKVNFKTEVCSKTADPNLTMHWIKEVEIAKSFEELVTSRSIMERTDFPHYDMLDATIASALKKLLNTHVHFRKRASVEEQLDQTYDRFLRVRQVAYMIHEHFRATGVYEAVQGLSDLFNIHMQNDDVQDFDVRWDQALLSASEIPTEMILERLYKSKYLQDSVQLQTVLALYDQETVRNEGQPSKSRLKTSVSLRIDHTMRTRNFRVRNEWPRVKKERKPTLIWRWDALSGKQMDKVRKETHAVSVMNWPLERQSSSPAPNSKAKTDGEGEKPSKKSGNRDESSSDERGKIPCRYRYCNNPSCSNWHPPVCQYYQSETGRKFGNKCFFRRVEADEKPSKKSKEGGAKGSVALLKGSIQLNCVSQDPHPRKSILRKEWKLGSNHTVKSPEALGTKFFGGKKGKKGSTARNFSIVCASRVSLRAWVWGGEH